MKNLGARLKPEDTRDALRLIGGFLLGLAALTLANRKSADWDAYAIFAVYLVPAVALFGGGVLTIRDTGVLRPWQSAFSVFGLIFVNLALFQFVDILGGNPDAPLHIFWVFGVTAVLAAYAGMEAGIRFQILAAGISFVIAFMALTDEIIGFSDNDFLFRLVLLIAAGIVIYAGIVIWRSESDREEGLSRFSETVTASGIATVIAFGLGTTTVSGEVSGLTPFLTEPASEGHWYWDVLLLVVSLELIITGTVISRRGPVYVGAFGLFVFSTSVGTSDTDLIWPAALVVLGAIAVWLSFTDFTLGNRPRELLSEISGHKVPKQPARRRSSTGRSAKKPARK